MENKGLLALAQLILPSEIILNFKVVKVDEQSDFIRIHLDEIIKESYKSNPNIESKGFCDSVIIRDFPIRDKGVDLIVRRRRWFNKETACYFSDTYTLKAEGTRYSKEFAAFFLNVWRRFLRPPVRLINTFILTEILLKNNIMKNLATIEIGASFHMQMNG